MELTSGLYLCRIKHTRFCPSAHSFEYDHYCFLTDLENLENVSRNWNALLPFALEKIIKIEMRNTDHLNIDTRSILDKARDILSDIGIEWKGKKIFLLANPRILGYTFNPLSVYFVIEPDPKSCGAGLLICALAEVHNTFKERKLFLLKSPHSEDSSRMTVLEALETKYFYISPFNKSEDQLRLRIANPGRSVEIQVDTIRDQEIVLSAKLKGTRLDINFDVQSNDGYDQNNESTYAKRANIVALIFRLACNNFLVISRIHWQALLLYLKGIEFSRKQERLDLQLPDWRQEAGKESVKEKS